jgi:hypothetical protein
MVLSKFDLAIVVFVAAGMLWIEHGHRTSIAAPIAAEAPAASACPDNDSVPFSADCIAFIDGGVSPAARTPVSAMTGAVTSAFAAPPTARRYAEAHAPACPPSNENSPYSARCIKFLSGWYWQPNPADRAP